MNPVRFALISVLGAGVVLLPARWPLAPEKLISILAVFLAVSLGAIVTVAVLTRVLGRTSYRFELGLSKLLWGATAICCGALISVWQFDSALTHRVSNELFGEDVAVRVQVESVIDERPTRQVFMARTVQAPSELTARRWRIVWYGVPKDEHLNPIEVAVDDEWAFTLRLRGLQGTGNPGGFDVSAWYLRTKVDAAAYVRSDPTPKLLIKGGESSINAWRANTAKRVRALLPDDHYDNVVVALTLGFRQGIEEEFRQLLVDTGTAHLLAISGLHIGLVSAAAFLLFKALWGFVVVHFRCQVSRVAFAGVLAVLVAAGYAVLAGLSPPTLRAVGMCAVAFIVLWQRRSLSPWVPFSFTLAAVVLSDVSRFLSVGVWLSFGTVALIIVLYRPSKNASKYSMAKVWRTHAAIGVCLLPISGWFFSQGSLVSPIANFIAVPLVSFVVVPGSLLVVALVNVWPNAAAFCLQVLSRVIQALERWLEICASIPLSEVPITVPSVPMLLGATLGVLCLCAPKSLSLRRFTLPLSVPVIVWSLGARTVDGVEVHVLDVGQGHASLILTKNHVVLVDTGGTIGGTKTQWEATVLPALNFLGKRSVDHVVISHSDSDHAAGAEEVAKRFPQAVFWLGGVTELVGAKDFLGAPQVKRCHAGQRWELDGVEFSFLYPSPLDVDADLIGQDFDDNDSSCVLLVQLGQSTVLFPGDIEHRGEATLLERVLPASRQSNTDKLPVNNNVFRNSTNESLQHLPQTLALGNRLTVLVAPHHGSSTSSTPEFVSGWRPEHVVFPAGYRNRLGFPHDDVVIRYKIQGSEVFETGQDGAVQFYLGLMGLTLPPTRYWVKHRRLWHTPR